MIDKPPCRARLIDQFGAIDIYIFDQLLRGRFDDKRTILDAGCGHGRNLVYFLQQEFELFGVDESGEAIAAVRRLAATLAPTLPPENFGVHPLDRLPYADAQFDAVICNAVLHFANNQQHFMAMVEEIWRTLRVGGLLFTRLASTIGIEHLVEALGGGRYKLPDGTRRFLVDDGLLREITANLGGNLLDPIKTTKVEDLRSMTTWCVEKC